VQGPGQAQNLRDNGFRVIIGQRSGGRSYDRAVADGWVAGETLFEIEEAAERATTIQYLLSDAGQISMWPRILPRLTAGKCLYFSHGFGITYREQTGIIPPPDVDVVLVAPKGSGTSLRRLFLAGKGLNASFAVFQDATGRAHDRAVSLGIGIGSGLTFFASTILLLDYFGRAPNLELFSLINLISTVGAAAPWAAGVTRDQTGSFAPFLLLVAGLMAAMTLLAVFLRRPVAR